jgi:hypothetical protein
MGTFSLFAGRFTLLHVKDGCLYNNILFLEVFLGCRLLAHARVESAKSKEAAIERERLRNSPWWTFGW